MPRYQAVIEFWAYRDSHADDAVRQAKDVIYALNRSTSENAAAEGVATGEVKVKSLLEVSPLDPSEFAAKDGASA